MNNKQFIKILADEIHLKLASMKELDDGEIIQFICNLVMEQMNVLIDKLEEDD